MISFAIRFFLCNIVIICLIGCMLCIRYLLRNCLSARTQYMLWLPLLFLMIVPLLPFRIPTLFHFLSLWHIFQTDSIPSALLTSSDLSTDTTSVFALTNDFTVSVSQNSAFLPGFLLLLLWTGGIAVMISMFLHSFRRLCSLRHAALPLENETVLAIYQNCQHDLGIHKTIPIYSTPYLKSPITTGIFHPGIYLPLNLVISCKENKVQTELLFILLHELQHCHYRDSIINLFMNLIGIVYWFNPVVWYVLKLMRTDRELACDSAVLQKCSPSDYMTYGHTLLNYAEKISLSPFSYVSGLSGNMTQMKKRIINIASYRPATRKRKMTEVFVYTLIAILFISLSPILSTYGRERDYYSISTADIDLTNIDLSNYFQNYSGSFVLYDPISDGYRIYNEKQAFTRISPDSTYKIYEGLMALENGLITPADSSLAWDGSSQPFVAWNADQDLTSAMQNSVNWYFEHLDHTLDKQIVQSIHYGNQDISAKTTCWMESSLKISPMEQVQLLSTLYESDKNTSSANKQAIKDALLLYTDNDFRLYGKTGTGRINDQDISGWFIGFIETNQ